jgi:tRNA dimethylallyltransferase
LRLILIGVYLRLLCMSLSLPPAIFLMGPTAAGKTALALALHELFPVEIVSVDSSQIYRGLDIGTAKPTRAEQERAPHRLIDIRDPAQTYSAAEFRDDARREMNDIARAGRIPLLVGGTMFYFHALEYGLTELPPADAAIRARLAEEGKRLGWPALHARLQAADPLTAGRIRPQDAQRIQRALEIIELTGQIPSQLNQLHPREPLPYRVIKLALLPSRRGLLHERIAQRFHAMLDRGLVGEVEGLKRRGDLKPDLPSLRTVGYRQVWEYLTGNLNYNGMVERAIVATRQLAKRQLTWLRHYPGVHAIEYGETVPEAECTSYLRRLTA